MLLAVVLVIDWSLAVTGVTAAVIGGIFRVVLWWSGRSFLIELTRPFETTRVPE